MQNWTCALIKPVSSSCNLRCRYCFYFDEASCRTRKNYGKMSTETLAITLNEITKNAKNGSTILFQGGEPLLAGASFYKFYNDLKDNILASRKGFNISSSIQTSLYTLDDDLIKEFKRGNFLIGVSLDGPCDLHNKNRLTPKLTGSFDKVFANIKKLQEQNIPINILCVVTKDNAYPKRLWDFYKENGFTHLQFIKALPPLKDGNDLISDDDFAKFFLEIFDLWFSDLIKGRYISVRLIDDIFSILTNRGCSSCDLHGKCTVQNVIEADGSVYPCDFYALDEWYMGNIHDGFDKLNQDIIKKFEEKPVILDECKTCNLFNICKNGCRRYRNDKCLSALCPLFKLLFKERLNEIKTVLSMISK